MREREVMRGVRPRSRENTRKVGERNGQRFLLFFPCLGNARRGGLYTRIQGSRDKHPMCRTSRVRKTKVNAVLSVTDTQGDDDDDDEERWPKGAKFYRIVSKCMTAGEWPMRLRKMRRRTRGSCRTESMKSKIRQKENKGAHERGLIESMHGKDLFPTETRSRPGLGERGVVYGLCDVERRAFSRRRTFVVSADGAWAIRVCSTGEFGVRREEGLGREGKGVD